MAHFAQLDENNLVIQVLVVDNEKIIDDNGIEQELLGVVFLQSLFGDNTRWLQTSYNGRLRKNYAGIGHLYDVIRDAFIPPQPFPSWALNESACIWEAPVPMPSGDGNFYVWNEEQGNWTQIK